MCVGGGGGGMNTYQVRTKDLKVNDTYLLTDAYFCFSSHYKYSGLM